MLNVTLALQYSKLVHMLRFTAVLQYTMLCRMLCVLLQHCNTLSYVTFVLLQIGIVWLLEYSFTCQPMDYSNSPTALWVSSDIKYDG
jgi:hypothetical protein